MSRNNTRQCNSADRRVADRHGHGERVVVTTQWGQQAGSLIDLSTSGAQVRFANGLVPVAEDEITLRLVDGRHISGNVVWSERDALGVRFEQDLPTLDDIIWLEQRGPDWFQACVRAQRQ